MLEGRSAPARSGLAARWSPLPVRRPVVVRRAVSVGVAGLGAGRGSPPGEVVSGRRSGRAGRARGWGGGIHPCRFPFGNLRGARRSLGGWSCQRFGTPSIGSVVRLTVTPLGASGQSASGVAAAVVNYLEGEAGRRGPSLLNRPTASVGAYYADSIEGPGRWLGAGAAFRDLDGLVGRDEFQRVLEGRHPTTGERLVTAQGSSQRGHLSVGTAARIDESGNALYTVRDAIARLLGTTRVDIEELVGRGEEESVRDPGDTSWISSTLHPVDGPLISDHEVSRHLESGSPDRCRCTPIVRLGRRRDSRSLMQRRAPPSRPRYVRRLCAGFEDEGSQSNRSKASTVVRS